MQTFVIRTIRGHRLLRVKHNPAYPSIAVAGASTLAQPFVIRTLKRRKAIPPAALIYISPPSNVPATPALIRFPKAFKVEFKTRLLKPQELDRYPVTPPIITTVLPVRPTKRVSRTEKKREVEFISLILSTLSFAPPEAYANPPVFRRRGFHRQLRVLESLYRPTTPTTAAVPPAYFAKKPFKVEARTKLLRPQILSFYQRSPERLLTAYTANKLIKRRDTDRKLLVPRQHNQWTVTPPKVFTIPAATQLKVFRREKQKRLLLIPPPIFGSVSAQPDILVAFRSGFKPEVIYLRGTITDAGYFEGSLTEIGYFLSWLGDYTAYLEGDMTDIGYFEGDL